MPFDPKYPFRSLHKTIHFNDTKVHIFFKTFHCVEGKSAVYNIVLLMIRVTIEMYFKL